MRRSNRGLVRSLFCMSGGGGGAGGGGREAGGGAGRQPILRTDRAVAMTACHCNLSLSGTSDYIATPGGSACCNADFSVAVSTNGIAW